MKKSCRSLACPENDGASLEVRPGMPRNPMVRVLVMTGAVEAEGAVVGVVDDDFCVIRDLTTKVEVGTDVEAGIGFTEGSAIGTD